MSTLRKWLRFKTLGIPESRLFFDTNLGHCYTQANVSGFLNNTRGLSLSNRGEHT